MNLRIPENLRLASLRHDVTLKKVHRPGGFALVVTLSLMILLTIIAVGLLTLSSVTLRTSTQGLMQARANSNAKLALMLAIGELQKQLGPDQRVSANGAILAESAVSNPNWAGVWDSWRAGTLPSGTTSPDTPSEHSTIAGTSNNGMNPTYAAQRRDHFRSWLVSLTPTQTANIESAKNLPLTGSNSPTPADTAVQLVGQGSLGPASLAANHVRAGLVSIKPSAAASTSGRYGWWVGDESQKARIMEDSYNSTPPTDNAEKVFRSQAPGSTGTTAVKGLEGIANDKQLSGLSSLQTLNLVTGAAVAPQPRPAENFHSITPFSRQVLADVREGGLKRDLSTLLERPVNPSENQDEFMLYRFDTPSSTRQERVPIHDLAAYYQLYDSNRDPADSTNGVRYSSSPQHGQLPTGIQVAAPDYGDASSPSKFTRAYTSMYRSPIPVKIEFLVGVRAEPILNAPPTGNTHRLVLGFLPAVTLWNPNNVPITMNTGDPNFYSQMLRFPNLSFAIEWKLSSGYVSRPVSLAYAASPTFKNTGTGQAGVNNKNEFIFDMYFSATNPIVFEPGEVRLFSYNTFNGNFSIDSSGRQLFIASQEGRPGWDTTGGFFPAANSAWTADPSSDSNFNLDRGNGYLAFKGSDAISFNVKTEKECALPYALQNSARGAAMNFSMTQKSNAVQQGRPRWGSSNYNFVTRTGSATDTLDFSDRLIRKGLPTQPFTKAISGAALIGRMNSGVAIDRWETLFKFGLMAGCETAEATVGTVFAGRKFASRPFLHSSPIASPYIDSDDNNSLYNYGWNWWIEEIGTVLEGQIESHPNNPRQGLYGGGYTITNGTSHVVQQEIPVTPPISIASLSHAHLGGYSTATGDPAATAAWDYSVLSAVGYGGLFPHTLQAIGNSYAHPNVAGDRAFRGDWSRTFVTGAPRSVTLADHSYLANKALWDEFFFSSITPQLSEVKIFENSTTRTARDVAQDFFFKDIPIPLPNRRVIPYKNNLDISQLDTLFSSVEARRFNDGLADKISSHLMVEGPFNVNSTSVDAWRVFLSSLKGKPVAFLDRTTALTGGVNLSQATVSGVAVGPSSLPNGRPIAGSSNRPSNADQWTNWRELSDAEIGQLAEAIVRQVKLRGPFLSLSEFVNRRLDLSNEDLAVKGALQAALDDPLVSINSGFRSAGRMISPAEIQSMNPAFPKALAGPVAYGSAAYVDQADVLRNFAEQLTPRGDTFVIRAYGDSIDSNGKVQARAWCEATLQRVPAYIDPSDQPSTKQSLLTSQSNRVYGRKFEIVCFRWLGSLEV